jgi:hypothetical protein
MEFLITASPNAFKRNEAGQVGDLRDSRWLQDNINFLAEKYGNNLIALTLHQDEKTPHLHAIVVPITNDTRLSAKELFNPKTLRSLQTDYAKAMSKYGFERGIEGSRARHQTMKQIYGQQQKVGQEIEADLKALQQHEKPLTIEKPSTFDLLNLERWRQQQEAKINAELIHRLNEARKVAEKAQKLATANATAAEQVKVLQQKLNTSEGLKQRHFKKARQLDQIVLYVDEGRVNKDWIHKQADQVRGQSLPQMEKDLLESLKNLKDLPQLSERLQGKGYDLQPKTNIRYVVNPKTGVRLDLHMIQLNGKSFVEATTKAMEQTRQRAADKKAAEEEAQRIANEKKNKQQPKLGRSTGGHSH